MIKRYLSIFLCFTLFPLSVCACSSVSMEREESTPSQAAKTETAEQESPKPNKDESTKTESSEKSATLLYMGQASIRIVTAEGKVIYIDHYAGYSYDLAVDLILVTHGNYDHCAVDKIKNRNDDCVTITQTEALRDGEHLAFDLGFVTVEVVEAGYNDWHDVNECVGYILTFSNGKSVYVTGDTSATEQMSQLAEKKIDYAFFCCDGVFNMGLEEAAQCAEMVGAKHNIPYHNTTSNTGKMFDCNPAEQFEAENRLIVIPGEELKIE